MLGTKGEERSRRPSRRGLANPRGASNCFLNVIVQCLWGLDSFLAPFMSSECQMVGHGHHATEAGVDGPLDGCIHCPLRLLFLLLRYDKKEQQTPLVLRVALSSFNSTLHKFQLNQMEDASECLTALLSGICCSVTSPPANQEEVEAQVTACHGFQCPAHQVFGLRCREEIACFCGSYVKEVWDFQFTVPSTSLAERGLQNRELFAVAPFPPIVAPQPALSLPPASTASPEKKKKLSGRFSLNFRRSSGDLARLEDQQLKEAEGKGKEKPRSTKYDDEAVRRTGAFEETLRKHESDRKGTCPECQAPLPPRILLHTPSVFVLNVSWDHLQIEKEEVALVFNGISPFLDIGKVFSEIDSADPTEMYLQCFVW